jgi:alkylation response protein AidB-like acyl-CoA dehydrogenase
MDFSLNKEQKMLRDMVREFFKAKCDKSVVRELEGSVTGHSPALWAKMAKLYWMGIIIPEEYGGEGLSLMEAAILFEENGRAALDSPLFCTLMATLAILEGGSEAQKTALLPKVASGELILTIAAEELEVPYDPLFVSLPATSKGDGYVINGTKQFVSYANVADYILVVARTKGIPGDEKGITVLMVDGKTPGITLTELATISPDRQFQVDFDNVSVSSDQILGGLNQGLALVRATIEKATVLLCAEMVGGAEYQLKATAEYTKEREQFDRPIGTFQAVQHQLADMFTDVQGSRWTTYQAVSRLSKGMPAAKEIAIAKAFTSDACQRAGATAHQLHGGIGVDTDNDLHFYFRRAKAMALKFGPSLIHLEALEAELGM